MEEGGREGLRGGQDEEKREEEEEAVKIVLSLTQRVSDHSQSHTDFPPNEKGVRKCNFSVWLLTDSLWRFLLGCGVECLPFPAGDKGARISEFRCLLRKSHQEEVKTSVCA